MMKRSIFWKAATIILAFLAVGMEAQTGPDKWKVAKDKNPMNDKPIVTASVRADTPIKGWAATVVPELVVRCQTPLEAGAVERTNAVMSAKLQSGLDFYVVTGMPATVENAEGRHTLHIRFGDSPAIVQNALESTDHKALMLPALFATTTIMVKQDLSKNDRMLVEFTPFNASPVIITFDVRGFAKHLDEVSAACPKVDLSGWIRR